MDPEYFEDLVDEALEDLPEEFAERLENVDIIVKALPGRKLLQEMGIRHGTLLGLYQGVPETQRNTSYGNILPDRILIFREPILDEADAACPREASDEEFEKVVRRVVRKTVLHEIGHHFGLTDDDLRRLNYH